MCSRQAFISRHTDKAFVKGHFTELSVIPAPLQPKLSLIGPLCKDAGISENWLFNSEDVYTGQATITIGLLLELILVKKATKGVSDIQCSETLKCNHGGSTKQVIKKKCLNVDDFLFHLI